MLPRRAGGEEMEAAVAERDQRLLRRQVPLEYVAEARIPLLLEHPAQRGPAQVGVDHQGRDAGLGAADRQVGREGRLPLAPDGAGDRQAATRPGGRLLTEPERDPQVVEALEEVLELGLAGTQ